MEKIYQDCPMCGRKNVVGQLKYEKAKKAINVGERAGFAVIGGFIGSTLGPLGTIAGAGIGERIGNFVDHAVSAKVAEEYNHHENWRFVCPNPDCQYTWEDYL